jgi:hypothetical protein
MIKPLDLLLAGHDGPTYPYSILQIDGIVLIAVVTSVAIAVSGLRVYSRTITKTFGLDDWLLCAATVCLQPRTPLCAMEGVPVLTWRPAAHHQPMLDLNLVYPRWIRWRTRGRHTVP